MLICYTIRRWTSSENWLPEIQGESQPSGSAAMCVPNQLRNSFNVLLRASIASSSRAYYQRAWGKFVFFHDSLGVTLQLSASVSMMLLFIAQCTFACAWLCPGIHYFNHLGSSLLKLYNKINGFSDPTNCFIVAKVLAGVHNLGSVSDVRLPVTLPVLTRLVLALPTVFTSRYKCLMLRAMMMLGFKAYLQVG